MSKIAVIGLGAMGARMAQRLAQAGHQLTVYNRSPERAAPLVQAGATLADSPKAAAAGADIVLTMLTDDAAAAAVWLDEAAGAIAGISPGAVALECSTVTPAWIHRLGKALDSRQVGLLDAPVAGSRPQAEAGQLIFLLGGETAIVERMRPVLMSMGGAIHHVGDRGAGAWMKLAVNSLFGAQIALVGELLGMLARAGVAPERAMATLGELPITSPAAKGVGGLVVANKHAPLFPIDLVEKDFRYALSAARSVQAELPAVEAVHRIYESARQGGHGASNISAVAKLYLDGA